MSPLFAFCVGGVAVLFASIGVLTSSPVCIWIGTALLAVAALGTP